MTPCPQLCKFGCEYEDNEARPEDCGYRDSNVQHRPEMQLVCELPPGTTMKPFDGSLVACHPDHAPIFIGGVRNE